MYQKNAKYHNFVRYVKKICLGEKQNYNKRVSTSPKIRNRLRGDDASYAAFNHLLRSGARIRVLCMLRAKQPPRGRRNQVAARAAASSSTSQGRLTVQEGGKKQTKQQQVENLAGET